MKLARQTDSFLLSHCRMYFLGRMLGKFLSIREQVMTNPIDTSYIIPRQHLYNSFNICIISGFPKNVGRVSAEPWKYSKFCVFKIRARPLSELTFKMIDTILLCSTFAIFAFLSKIILSEKWNYFYCYYILSPCTQVSFLIDAWDIFDGYLRLSGWHLDASQRDTMVLQSFWTSRSFMESSSEWM